MCCTTENCHNDSIQKPARTLAWPSGQVDPIFAASAGQFRIFVVEQALPVGKPADKFNKAKLMNAGFVEIRILDKWDCIILHDVDWCRNMTTTCYRCFKTHPTHYFRRFDENKYAPLPDNNLAKCPVYPEQYKRVNGYSICFGAGVTRTLTCITVFGYPDERKREMNPPELGYYSSLETGQGCQRHNKYHGKYGQ
uniref:Galactosyltransferase N-terminal domain-containing protein n=1 Tax=Globodera rostochiensis TaxID=31243 RepID=A0A914HAN7_GLORO